MSPRQLVLLLLAGALGTLARYGLILLIGRAVSLKFPLGTLIINIIGCFLFGVVWMLATDPAAQSGLMDGLDAGMDPRSAGVWRLTAGTRDIILIGFMGAFTTFSTFAFDAQHLWRSGSYGAAVGYVLASNVVGIGGLLAGMWIGGRVARFM